MDMKAFVKTVTTYAVVEALEHVLVESAPPLSEALHIAECVANEILVAMFPEDANEE